MNSIGEEARLGLIGNKFGVGGVEGLKGEGLVREMNVGRGAEGRVEERREILEKDVFGRIAEVENDLIEYLSFYYKDRYNGLVRNGGEVKENRYEGKGLGSEDDLGLLSKKIDNGIDEIRKVLGNEYWGGDVETYEMFLGCAVEELLGRLRNRLKMESQMLYTAQAIQALKESGINVEEEVVIGDEVRDKVMELVLGGKLIILTDVTNETRMYVAGNIKFYLVGHNYPVTLVGFRFHQEVWKRVVEILITSKVEGIIEIRKKFFDHLRKDVVMANKLMESFAYKLGTDFWCVRFVRTSDANQEKWRIGILEAMEGLLEGILEETTKEYVKGKLDGLRKQIEG